MVIIPAVGGELTLMLYWSACRQGSPSGPRSIQMTLALAQIVGATIGALQTSADVPVVTGDKLKIGRTPRARKNI